MTRGNIYLRVCSSDVVTLISNRSTPMPKPIKWTDKEGVTGMPLPDSAVGSKNAVELFPILELTLALEYRVDPLHDTLF